MEGWNEDSGSRQGFTVSLSLVEPRVSKGKEGKKDMLQKAIISNKFPWLSMLLWSFVETMKRSPGKSAYEKQIVISLDENWIKVVEDRRKRRRLEVRG